MKIVRTSKDDSRVMSSSKLGLRTRSPKLSLLILLCKRFRSLGPVIETGACRKVKILGGRANIRRYRMKSVWMERATLRPGRYGAIESWILRISRALADEIGVDARESAVNMVGMRIASNVKTTASTVGPEIDIFCGCPQVRLYQQTIYYKVTSCYEGAIRVAGCMEWWRREDKRWCHTQRHPSLVKLGGVWQGRPVLVRSHVTTSFLSRCGSCGPARLRPSPHW